ncbi:sensor histidine kinase [Rhizorhabdus dicambivorans]|uniref:histidine kinase n=1 Tax=Rhizorhabdus dicambivorans TaxID=1850238 RepID=A0A2A4FW22_9SPHN|nr:ATP-binding protein [Rhizorhabdus dicambivorans]ATE64497.1 ATP-binding protein [Rhizorhabdus dicambivorans]PCE41591.1 ATP-binding protein [Rhizorhabdus dicambivorans]
MAFDRHFSIGLAWRLTAVALTLWALVYSFERADLVATKLLAAVIAAIAIWALWSYVRRTNVELARFIEAVTHGDLSQGFSSHRHGGGFDALGQQLDSAMRRLREERAQAADAGRFNAALVDEAPVALLVIDGERVELANRAARKLFGRTEAVRIADYAPHGADFVAALEGSSRRIAAIEIDGRPQRAVLTGAEIHRLGHPLRLLTVQPLHGELDAVEIAAQADLVRVLTHEIMNSMTPVASLAQSAAGLMAEIETDDPRIAPQISDARLAVSTLARRAEGIMHFVEGYRAFIRTPTIRARRFPAGPWAEEMQRLFAATAEGQEAELAISIVPADMVLDGDPDLMAQAVLNLLKNGAEAAIAAGRAPRLKLSLGLIAGGRSSIMLSDNGPGIAPDQAGDIFLPFFTTKAKGTGVGLSLVRRIVTAHGGTITIRPSDAGACIEMIL